MQEDLKKKQTEYERNKAEMKEQVRLHVCRRVVQ